MCWGMGKVEIGRVPKNIGSKGGWMRHTIFASSPPHLRAAELCRNVNVGLYITYISSRDDAADKMRRWIVSYRHPPNPDEAHVCHPSSIFCLELLLLQRPCCHAPCQLTNDDHGKIITYSFTLPLLSSRRWALTCSCLALMLHVTVTAL